jgi:hypothetical protein
MKETDGLSTIVWVSIPIRPKLASRVRRCLQKVIILNCDGLWTLAIVWRVERPNSWFLAIWLVEINGLSTFGHSVKRPLEWHWPTEQRGHTKTLSLTYCTHQISKFDWYDTHSRFYWYHYWCCLLILYILLVQHWFSPSYQTSLRWHHKSVWDSWRLRQLIHRGWRGSSTLKLPYKTKCPFIPLCHRSTNVGSLPSFP